MRSGRSGQVGTTAQLFFFDWEPNLIGPERVIGGRPGQQPPPVALKEANKQWRDAGRNTNTYLNRQLILSGALPDRLRRGPARLQQPPVRGLRHLLDRADPLLPLLQRRAPRADRRARADPQRPLRHPDRKKTLAERDRARGPGRHDRRLRAADRPGRRGRRHGGAGLVRAQRRPGALGHRHHRPEAELRRVQPADTSPSASPTEGREAFQEVTRRIAQRGQAQAIGPVGTEQAAALSGHFAVVLDNEVKTRPIINFVENPDGIDGRTGAQISGGFTDINRGAGPGDVPADRRPADQPEADQPDAGLGDARRAGARTTGIKAGLIGLLLVVLFLLLFYRFLGLIAATRPRRLRDHLLRPDQADPDHADPAGDRRADPDDRGRGRLEHRHLRANKGGGARRALDVERDRGRLQTRDRDDHRRQRRHPADRLHPLRAGDRRGQGLRLHPRRRHDRLAAAPRSSSPRRCSAA